MKCLTYADTVLKRIVTQNISALNALVVATVARKPGLTCSQLQALLECSPGPIHNSPYLHKDTSFKVARFDLNTAGRELAVQLFSKPAV